MKKLNYGLLLLLIGAMQPLFGSARIAPQPHSPIHSLNYQAREFAWGTPEVEELKESFEISSEKGCLALIQQSIRHSPHRIIDWSSCPKGSDAHLQGSNCLDAAIHICWRFTGINVFAESHNIIKHPSRCREYEYAGDSRLFYEKDGDRYKKAMAQNLLSDSITAEHLLFYITINGNLHAYTIEKKSDGVSTWWRIYQSWYNTFTMGQWLALDPWKVHRKGTNFDEQFEKYGSGKQIGRADIENFMHEITLDTERFSHLSESKYYIRCFDLEKNLNLQPLNAPMPVLIKSSPPTVEVKVDNAIEDNRDRIPNSPSCECTINRRRLTCLSLTLIFVGLISYFSAT